MRICFISTYPPIECGIATYTQYLTWALRRKQLHVYIVSHYGGSGRNVFEAFDYEDGDLASKAFSMITRLSPDLVHIQHEFGLFGKQKGVSLTPLYLQLKMVGIPTVTTLHTVLENHSYEESIILSYLVNYSDGVIIHESYQYEILKKLVSPENLSKVQIIPHGARDVRPIKNAKAILGINPSTKVILMIGYFAPHKGFEDIIDLWPRIYERLERMGEDVLLIIAGKVRTLAQIEYGNMLFNKINLSSHRDKIRVIRGQISQQSFDTVICAADVVVLPYKRVSQSGILAHCLAFGKPVVISNVFRNDFLKETEVALISNSKEDYVENIVRLLTDKDLYERLSKNAKEYVKKKVSWDIIAEKHIDLYRKFVEPSILKVKTIWMD